MQRLVTEQRVDVVAARKSGNMAQFWKTLPRLARHNVPATKYPCALAKTTSARHFSGGLSCVTTPFCGPLSYCLSAALLLAVATSGNALAAAPEAPGLAKKDPPGVPPGQAKKGILQIESLGSRTFGGINKYNPTDPTGSRYLSCDHGVTEWAIPVGPGKHPHVLTHGSGIRGYIMTFDGQPGFQTIFLRDKYPVYLIDFPWTGRAARACDTVPQYTPNLNANTIVQNRIATWPLGQPQPTYLPGIAFSQDPEALN